MQSSLDSNVGVSVGWKQWTLLKNIWKIVFEYLNINGRLDESTKQQVHQQGNFHRTFWYRIEEKFAEGQDYQCRLSVSIISIDYQYR